jgi:hypothetical protein
VGACREYARLQPLSTRARNHRHPPSAHNHSPLAQGAIKRMESHHQRAESTAAEATAHLRAELASVKEAVQRETSSRAEYVEWRVAYCCPRGPRGEGRRGRVPPRLMCAVLLPN